MASAAAESREEPESSSSLVECQVGVLAEPGVPAEAGRDSAHSEHPLVAPAARDTRRPPDGTLTLVVPQVIDGVWPRRKVVKNTVPEGPPADIAVVISGRVHASCECDLARVIEALDAD